MGKDRCFSTVPAGPDNPAVAWKPIETAPRDGNVILIRQGRWAPWHAFWSDGWRPIEHHFGINPTHWATEAIGRSGL